MIQSYSFGEIVIDGKRYKSDVKIIDGKVIPDWWRKEGHSIFKQDVEDIIAAKPDILIIGTGSYGVMKIPEQFRELMNSLNIELMAAKTDEACKLFNKLSAEKRVCFGAHLTC